jgi:hypothetical protein
VELVFLGFRDAPAGQMRWGIGEEMGYVQMVFWDAGGYE